MASLPTKNSARLRPPVLPPCVYGAARSYFTRKPGLSNIACARTSVDAAPDGGPTGVGIAFATSERNGARYVRLEDCRTLLLLPELRFGEQCRGLLRRSVHPLVPAVLVRSPRGDAFG